jgi:hypothetical protein
VTVAIACKFQDGLLFCADTKLSTGNEKRNESKIHWKRWGPSNNSVSVFALAGDVDYAAAAIEKCERAIARLRFNETSLDEIQETIELVLAGFYQAHVYPHPSRREIDFNLLIGLWLNGETRFLVSKETAVRRVHGYECIGSGGYLARYVLRQALGSEIRFEPEKLTKAEATVILEHAIDCTVEYDEACGYEENLISQDAEYVGMMRDGETGDLRTDPNFLYMFPGKLQAECWGFVRRLAANDDLAEQETALEEFFNSVRKTLWRRKTFPACI